METFINIDQQLLLLLNGSNSLFFDGLMMTLTDGLTWIPLYVVLIWIIIKNNETMPLVLLTIGAAICCVVVTAGVTNLIVKPIVERPRPCNDPSIKYLVDTICRTSEKDYSFFSAHAANTFGLALFVMLLIRNKALTIAMVLWSMVNCYTRLYLGLHYPIDILTGLLFGAVVGIVAYCVYLHVYRKLSTNANFVSTQFTTTGYSIQDVDVVICVLVMVFVYALIRACVVSI